MKKDTSVRFLVVSSDPAMEEEFEAAIRGIKSIRAVANYERDVRSGIEAARLRLPDVVVIEMRNNITEVKAFAEEIGVVAPHASVVVAYRRQVFVDPDEESRAIIEVLRARVRDFLRRPVSTGELQQVIDRLFRSPEIHHGELGKVISFVSNKGGVGKSTVSTNVACELGRRHPGRVLLVDVSLQLGICASMLNLETTQSIADAAQQLDRLDTTLLQQLSLPHPSGLRVLAAPPTVLAASDVNEDVVGRVVALGRRVYDYVIVDTFPVLDSVVMSVLDLSNIVCVVTQVMVPVLNGAASLLETFDELGLDPNRVWTILNRAQPSFSGELKPSDIEEHLGVRLRHIIPYEKRIPMSVNLGQPAVLSAGKMSAFRRAMSRFVDDLEAQTGGPVVRSGIEDSPLAQELTRESAPYEAEHQA